uniref:Uncharacterized protein n=1 Tax=Megaselia scalaris TaxID=36166 RepID=T1GB33_MEGSC
FKYWIENSNSYIVVQLETVPTDWRWKATGSFVQTSPKANSTLPLKNLQQLCSPPGQKKSTTPWKFFLEVFIDDEQIPNVMNSKILGVTFDNLQTKHSGNVCNSVSSRNRSLKTLAGTSWGKDKETIVFTYKTSYKSVINYCSPIWTSFLQYRKNSALCIATGCHSITHPYQFYDETSMLPVKSHNELLTTQFLLA